MFLKSKRMFVIILIMAGVTLSFLNFVPKLYAPPIWGTSTYLAPQEYLDMVDEYGQEYMDDRYLTNFEWCLYEDSNCCIVF